MRSWGLTIIVLAVLSAALPYAGMQFIFLTWVDNWGTTIGWIIRGGLILVGVAMFLLDRTSKRTLPS